MEMQKDIVLHRNYWDRLLSSKLTANDFITIKCLKQGWGEMQINRTICTGNGPLTLAGKEYAKGFGTHTDSDILLTACKDMGRLKLTAGVNESELTKHYQIDPVIFRIIAADRILAQSPDLMSTDAPYSVDMELPAGCRKITLQAVSANGNIAYGHANWCDVEITGQDGVIMPFDLQTNQMDTVPFSFDYNGISSKTFLLSWARKITCSETEKFFRKTVIFTNPADNFECTFTIDSWKEYPVSYYRVAFANKGNSNSGVLSNVKVLDDIFHAASYTCSRGGFDQMDKVSDFCQAFADDFRLYTCREHSIMTGGNGRSSSDWMPFVRLNGAKNGSIISVGWTGQWQMELDTFRGEYVRIQAGMAELETYLMPGEEISQPGILRLDYDGSDPMRGHNILRSFLLNEWIPANMRQAPVTTSAWGGMTAPDHLKRIEMMKQQKLDLDCYWIDAGWFGHGSEPNQDEFAPYWSSNVGCWEINEHVYPNGLKEVADAVHDAGMKLLLWIEPERACPGTPIVKEHPEYFCNHKTNNCWLNLAKPGARQWMLETITNVLQESGADYYRQDSNDFPLPFWRNSDDPGRKGMTEIKAVEGLYWVLDELHKRFPGIVIDNCASGGRRLDIEMMRRSIPLWPTDMQCTPDFDCESLQELSAGLNMWLPVFGWGTHFRPGDTYNFRCNLASGMNNHIAMYEYVMPAADHPWDWQRKMLADHRRAQPLLSGDYYPLLGQSYDRAHWMILEFYRSDLGRGVLNIMRRSESDYKSAVILLKGLDAGAVYMLEDADTGIIGEFSGDSLMNTGINIDIPAKRSARLIFFSKK